MLPRLAWVVLVEKQLVGGKRLAVLPRPSWLGTCLRLALDGAGGETLHRWSEFASQLALIGAGNWLEQEPNEGAEGKA